MKTQVPSKVSLFDLGSEKRVVEWFVVYYPREPYFFWAKWLKQGFRHVDLWRRYSYGPLPTDAMWLRLRPTFEALESEIEFDPTPPWVKYPDATVQRVQVVLTNFKVREWFAIGPPSCVETVKNALAIRSFWTRTAYQLYKYINRRGGVIHG